jgi:Domain of unknown function (DUF4145)
MGVKRDRWKPEFYATSGLIWPCPSCGASPLRVIRETIADGQTRASKALQENDWAGPEHIDGRFSCLMDCANCGNTVGSTGTFHFEDNRRLDERRGEMGDFDKRYSVRYFTESPLLVDIPEATPEPVVEELLASFQLFWSDPLGCANRIRSAVEKLLTSQKVPQTNGKSAKAGGRKFLTLHARIERYRAKQPSVADKLMAVKWVGNAGSHAGAITTEDALDGYELLDWVLDTLYARRHRRAPTLSKAINRRRAPRSPRRGAARKLSN